MNAVFTPAGLVVGVLAGQISRAVDVAEAPRPKHGDQRPEPA